ACGTSALQFINYIADGTSYNFSSLVAGDQFTGYVTDSLGTANAWLSGNRANQQFSFNFDHTSAPGTYAVTQVYIHPFGSCAAVAPLNVVITSYPATVGNFFEGSISGQVKDISNVVHTISCSFRIRRTH